MSSIKEVSRSQVQRVKSALLGMEVTNMKDRKRQRENRKIKKTEEAISKRNDFGIKDLTAFNAVMQIKTNGKAAILLR